MKKAALFLLFLSLTVFTACESGTETPKDAKNNLPKLQVWTVPAQKEKISDYSKAIKDDLNKNNFEVIVSTTDSTAATGKFLVELNYGGNKNSTVKTFPKWYENNVVKPIVKGMDTLDYGAVIGFDPGDGSFKELYEITVKNKEIKMQQTKMYGTLVD
ncbi:hypothetical protein DBR32_11785 [Taibaiella sp. KBW10]|uniref:hypothetical protein n=1 Tax=Taibaiella sp. KBW10 TaxID=2153357 RepID=UPI000F5A6763|nr:hypothetical protein [Taibaiella sp. KBW10]RQO30249.1 hypothetical protein DBR32_11785 [Taibaiella sp. KBW10]